MACIVSCIGHYHALAKQLEEPCPCCLGFEYCHLCDNCNGAGTIETPKLPRISNAPTPPLVRCTPCNGRGYTPCNRADLERIGFRFLEPVK